MDLKTTYLGIELTNPLIAGASVLSRDVDTVRALEDAGVAGVVLYSLFAEQIEHELAEHHHHREAGADGFGEAQSFMPALDYCPRGPDEYVSHLAKVKESVGIPVMASLNGHTRGAWVEYARMLEQAGADAIELNLYHVATDPLVSATEVEDHYLDTLAAVKEHVGIPVAVKLSPFFTSLPHFAKRLDQRGADGLVLFNRFYQPDVDLETLSVTPDLVLSAPHEVRLPLRWIAILDPLIDASIAATTAVYTWSDVLKLLMAGADVTMLCATLLRGGPAAATKILKGMANWMEEHEYVSVEQLKGSMNQRACPDPSAFERANYMEALNTYASS